jgi:hypothetical protein
MLSLWIPLAVLLLPSIATATASDQLPFLTPPNSDAGPLDETHRLFHLPQSNTYLPSPAFGAGSSWKISNETDPAGLLVRDAVVKALKTGYRHLGDSPSFCCVHFGFSMLTRSRTDNAAFYQTESFVAAALELSGVAREELYLTSKYDYLLPEAVTEVSVEKEIRKSLALVCPLILV